MKVYLLWMRFVWDEECSLKGIFLTEQNAKIKLESLLIDNPSDYDDWAIEPYEITF